VNIVIQYSAERGFEEAALIFARRLFARYDENVESLALVPDEDDDLAVFVDGVRVHSASESGRLPRLADLAEGR
jgi:predicted Rdx family selenoprotein